MLLGAIARECVLLLADSSLTGNHVALALSQAIAERGTPVSITVDNGTEFASKAMDVWAYQYGVQLDFIRPGRPVENGYIESFNGRLRDECDPKPEKRASDKLSLKRRAWSSGRARGGHAGG